VGQELARRLFTRFGSLAAMAKAGETGLAEVPGIGARRAEAIAARLAELVANELDSAK
jgi:ERCC4-type nuclease